MNNQPSYNRQVQIDKLIKENISLKKKLKLYQEKEKLYKSSIIKIKKYQSECQITFIKSLNDYKAHEDKIKKSFINYQKLLEKHYKSNENRFIEENNSLNIEIKKRNNIIKNLNKKISILSEKLNKAEFDFKFKKKKLVDEVVSKDRQLNELNESMIQLAKDTNDEIKLLRDEFKLYKNEKKQIRKSGNSLGVINNDDLFDKNNYYNTSNKNNKNDLNNNIYLNKKIYSNEDINYLINRLYLLENQNKNLIQKLRRKEEELLICNNLKNELIYNNDINNYASFLEENINNRNILKFQNLEKMLLDYGNKINDLKTQYDESLIRHQNEIQEIKNNYENNIINNKNDDMGEEQIYNEDNNDDDDIKNYDNYINDEYFNNYDINELQITSNKNNGQFLNYDEYQNDKNMVSEEGIKDEYINSQLPKINTLD